MAQANDDSNVVYPQVFTLHWEGPAEAEPAPEHRFPRSAAERRDLHASQRERERGDRHRRERALSLWDQIRAEAARRGDEDLWRRKLEAYAWVKLEARGSAGDYARRKGLNHATVRTWIADAAKLAYQVGYRLHEDRLLLVGEAPESLRRLRELVNRDAGSREAWEELQRVAVEARDEDPYFHLNEGHVYRAHGRLRESDRTLRDGLAIAEASSLRALLWNARGQTFWECDAGSSYPLPDQLSRADRCFRRAVLLDRSAYFPFVNLAQLGADAGDLRRAEYWIGELGAARKGMDDAMKDDLARYLNEAEWTGAVEGLRLWKSGPARWLREAVKKGVIPLLALLLLVAGLAPQASADAARTPLGDSVQHSPLKARGGAGGN